jgi:uncharacterized protein GlcG (DUF336 family)
MHGDSANTDMKSRGVATVIGLGAWLGLAAARGSPGTADAADALHQDASASARSLPADIQPPFGMLDADGRFVPPPPISQDALHRDAGSPPPATAPGPSLFLALEAAQAAVARCHLSGYRVGVSVVDSAGEPRAMLNADGSDGSHVFLATRKAITALAFGMPSAAVAEALAKDSTLLARVTPAMFVDGGALPITAGGKIIGAIGVSGAGGVPMGREDEVCAAAGVKKLESLRK